MTVKTGRTVLPTPLPGPNRKWSPAVNDSVMPSLGPSGQPGCTICGKPVVARGWCRRHYTRWHRHGDPHRESARSASVSEWFWGKVDRCGENECWPWQGSRSKHGYGWFKFNGKMARAHRVAWILTNGPLGKSDVIRHSCDNPPCCNPAHLLPGSQTENVADMDDRQRRRPARGERINMAKLTAGAVRELRMKYSLADHPPWALIGADYGVSGYTIRDAIYRRTWRHLP